MNLKTKTIMTLTTYKPFFSSPSRLLASFLGESPFEGLLSSGGQHIPAINLREGEKAYEAEVAAPGLKKDNFSITEEDGLLRISCTVGEHKKDTDTNEALLHEEFSYLNWSRHIQLPKASIDTAQIKASYKDGLLQVHVPKRSEALKSTKTISIE